MSNLIHSKILNVGKTDYNEKGSLFKGQDPGVFDTLHPKHPTINKLFKHCRGLDWDEVEFDFAPCNAEFKRYPKELTDRMINTLAWQWEADSVASKSIFAIMSNFITDSSLARLWGRINDNEMLHAATYSEIVRNSFDDPNSVLETVMSNVEAMQRLSVIGNVMRNSYTVSHKVALGIIDRNSDEAYDAAMLFTAALLMLERIQFMASFAITFAFGKAGMFSPIATAVQRICQDEYEVHVQTDKYVLKWEFGLQCGKEFKERHAGTLNNMLHEVVSSEWKWIDFMDIADSPLVGVTAKMLKDTVSYFAGDVANVLDVKADFTVPRSMPMPWFSKWIDISKTQKALQEERNGQYKVNMLRRILNGKRIEVDF
jgi:ribonucleoside-diphosphate reductase beta chain